MSRYRILSLDGGGIRGYLSVLLLERLEAARPGFLEQIDLLAGTSTGSIIALALAAGKTPAEVRELYEAQGAYIFHDSLLDNVRDLGFMLGAKYSTDHLKQALTERFGSMRLRDLQKRALVASFDLEYVDEDEDVPHMWKAKFFHNYPGEDSDECELVVDVALRSSAAPFYFPSYQGYVDGFVVANNPSMCALTQVLDAAAADLDEIVLLSVGTGLNPRYIDAKRTDWGWIRWMIQVNPLNRHWYALPLVYMMWEGGVNLANYQCRQLIHKRFHRLDPLLPTLVDIDEVARMPVLKSVARAADLEETIDWLDAHFMLAPQAA